MMRFFSSLCALVVLAALTGCSFPGQGNNSSSSGLKEYIGIGYSMQIPASWESVQTESITAPVRGTLELALRSMVQEKGFTNNLILLSDSITGETSSGEYLRQNMLWASANYLTVNVVSDEALDFVDKGSGRLVIYHAKYNMSTEERLFIQTARICDNKAYLLTIGLENSTTPETYAKYRTIMSSFACGKGLKK